MIYFVTNKKTNDDNYQIKSSNNNVNYSKYGC